MPRNYGRDRVCLCYWPSRPWCVFSGLLPERECKPQVALCPQALEPVASGALARRQPIALLTLDAALFRLRAHRPARTPCDQSAPRFGLHPAL